MKLTLITIAVGASLGNALFAAAQSSNYTAHEWGTFTSFQGSDGTLMPWRPLETSKLPGFVYDWTKPGYQRVSTSELTQNLPNQGGKGDINALQRMETPVIYFYPDSPMPVDVTVKFPKGVITEWYPQASQIGPATGTGKAPEAALVSNNFVSSESLIHWSDLLTLPRNQHMMAPPTLPTDTTGTNYFAARETDSASLMSIGNTPSETEKFLFYRGVGNFGTPLRVVMKSDDGVNLANNGNEPISHLFVLSIKGGQGRYLDMSHLDPGSVSNVVLSSATEIPLSELSQKLGADMATALAQTGLYPKEAAAMVKTWQDSWFTEPGVRVLYLLPRAWTDDTLPISFLPQPQSLVRTMVGRTEILAPGLEQELSTELQGASQGSAVATSQAQSELRSLGRFASPAFNRASQLVNFSPQEANRLKELLLKP